MSRDSYDDNRLLTFGCLCAILGSGSLFTYRIRWEELEVMFMPRVIAQQVELDLTLDQVLSIVRQLKPQEREVVRRVIEPPWSQRLETLLARVWARVERHPIAEEDINAEVELARTAIYAQSSC